MRTVTRRWWKAAAAVVLAAGGYALVAPERAATAQPQANPQWMRSSSPLSPAAAAGTPLPPAPGAIIPASAVLPAAPQPPIPPLPALPNTPPVPPPAAPVLPAAPTLPAAPMQLDFKAPVAPKLPDVPAPVLPVAPPAPPAKSAPPAQPTTPAKAVSPLRPADTGNTVKADTAWKAAPPVAPAPRVADRPKPPEVPVPPSERDVFALPKPPAPALVPPPEPAPVVGPVAPPVVQPMPAPVVGPVVPPAAVVPVPPPAVPAVPVATTPGANPMTFKSTAAAAVLGGALLAPNTVAQDASKDKDAATKTADQKLEEIQKSLTRLTELLDGKKDSMGYPLPSDPGVVRQLKELKDDVALLKSQFEALKSTSLRPPAGAGSSIPGVPNPMPGANPPAVAQQGTVRVVNEYPIEITMVVNGRTYRVAPNASQDIPVTVGEFSYQLLSANVAAAPTRSTIRASEVVTLRIK